MKYLDFIIGVGEIGEGLHQLFNEFGRKTCGFDLVPARCFGHPTHVDLMHLCIPFTSTFVNTVRDYYQKWKPKCIVVHSTVRPGTTKLLHKSLHRGNLIYSPIRGVHTRMLLDLKRYTKFYAHFPGTEIDLFTECFQEACGLTLEPFSTPFALEVAKILIDTSYYGWIIAYGQLVDKLCMAHNLEYDELWKFADEIHQYLGNRPRIYVNPQGIGGHCIIQNLDFIVDSLPELKETIISINKETKRRYQQKALR